METTKIFKIESRVLLFILVAILMACNEDFMDKFPYDSISEGTFWKTEDDALMALTGVYNHYGSGTEDDFFNWRYIFLADQKTDNGYLGGGVDRERLINGSLNATNSLVESIWDASYFRIAKCNYFLENIDNVDMDESKKAAMKGEVKFIRGAYYFYMSQFWGGVPLVTKTLLVEEANNVSVDSKETVVNFALSDLTEAAASLPATRPDSERGRAVKAAALAFKGRLLMAEERWSEASETYKSIIDLGVHSIDPRYKELFLEEGEDSPEIIFAVQYTNEGKNYSRNLWAYGRGFNGMYSPLNSLVEAYECTDGLPIDESSLYDPLNPWAKDGVPYRDPRLYYTILVPGYSLVTSHRDGQKYIYETHPDSLNAADRMPDKSLTGFCWFKYYDEEWAGANGNFTYYGGDMPVIRYAEVLLSYLESKLEAGDAITQDLLDQTINQVRGRAAVNMPPVTETNKDNLRTILRRERRVELALEGVRQLDILRWHIAHIVLNGPIYGRRVCNDPGNCAYVVDDEGHYYVNRRDFREDVDYNWPIPQNERDVNPTLEQKPGY